MTGQLASEEIDPMLRAEWLARLACVLPDGRPYVIPIAYAYDGSAFYSYFPDGQKREALRLKPEVCLVVDRVVDAANWKSIVAWGLARPLEGDEADDALRRISTRLQIVATADHASHAAERTYVDRAAPYGTLYRIDVTEATGRYSTG